MDLINFLRNHDVDDLNKMFVEKTIILKKDILINQYSKDGVFFVDEMQEYEDKKLKIINIWSAELINIDGQSVVSKFFNIKEDNGRYTWSFDWIDCIVEDEIISSNSENPENQSNIQKGDLVRLIEKSFKIGQINEIDKDIYGIPIKSIEYINHINRKGKKLVVCDIIDGKILPYFLSGTYNAEPITLDMIELEEKNYLDNIKTLKQKKGTISKVKQQVLDDIELIEEMKLKVNIKDFKKIYAGSMKRIPNNLKGIEQIIHHWACNKKHLYKLLGNKLSIQKEIEVFKDKNDVENDRQELYKAFPGCYDVINRLYDEEILTNKFNREIGPYNYNFLKYLKTYNEGDKVSKMLDEAFHNEKLNMLFSDIIAQNKIKGFVEISIDPIEYLLASCNQSGWTSCHRMFQVGYTGRTFGGWSAGVLGYMCDDVSMIAFRHNNKLYDYQINNQKIQAHSKSWRQMIWINKELNLFFASRQYPNKIDEVAKAVREMLEEQIDNNITDEKNWIHSEDKSKMKRIITDRCELKSEILHYNDILYDFNADMCYKKDIELKNNSVKVGSNPICPNCGLELMKNHNYPECTKCHNSL